MKRLALRTLLFLLLGAAINIAVAWACALYRAWGDFDVGIVDAEAAAKGWPIAVPPSWAPPNEWMEAHSFGFTRLWVVDAMRHLATDGKTPMQTVQTEVEIERAGWPLRCLQSTRVYPLDWDDPSRDLGRVSSYLFTFRSWRAGIERLTLLSGGGSRSHHLPLEPLWFAFLFDAVVYGGALLLAFHACARVRRRRRAKARLCPTCAYPVGASPVCTECGKPVKPRPAAPA